MDGILFYLFGGLAVLASLLVIGQRNPMHSVLFLVGAFLALAGLYVLLDSPFAAVTQIIVYGGAIMVLFLFVVMLLNAPREDVTPDDSALARVSTGPKRLGVILATLFAVEVLWALSRFRGAARPGGGVASVREIGVVLFTDHAFAFEVTSILILVAMLGAVVLAKRHI
ncbi:MAG: NADH-quinone oxidoreductase subunit J [Vicinamibacterales bacterium]